MRSPVLEVRATLLMATLVGCGSASAPPPSPTPDVMVSDTVAPVDVVSPPLDAGVLPVDAPAPMLDVVQGCPPTQVSCDGRCVDLQRDRAHCGACGTACMSGQVCAMGTCRVDCPTGQTVCGGACASLMTDAANCGACGNACPTGLLCNAGTCGLSCTAGLTACGVDAGRRCVDLQGDRAHCGACGAACASGEVCTAGRCTLSCPAGQSVCGDRCVDTQTDRAHCGACGTACPSGQVCAMGACTTTCPGGQTACGNRCADLQNDPLHCGACGSACPAGQACVAGACRGACPSPNTLCGNVCVDTRYHPDHCGRCGQACPPYPNLSRTCGEGVCVPGVCSPGFANCNGNIVDGCEVGTQTDPNNCGMCGRSCPAVMNATGVCLGGNCAIGACNAGFADCDGNPTTGCEANLQTDRMNCGACGTTCPGVCRDSVCVATIHNSEPFTSTTLPSGGCNFASTWQHNWVNLGSMPFRACLRAASRVGGMLAASVYTTPQNGWYGHRLGSNAMTGGWSTYVTANIDTNQPCIVGRDRRSTTRDATLAETLTHDGQTWRFEDYGPRFYDECQLLASNAGASIITPHTLGRTATAAYWVHQIHLCNVYAYVNSAGTGFSFDNYNSNQRSSQQRCMVGYVDN